ncbi:hypothetical protein GTG28_05155 [Vibrio sp. OCN044]|uniref:Uncharacterized protein n=1 Tax=Vibrio tetraodonis subsp. pristinus TaxID=2695891 RepID=A0A6L8LTT2_9VIBR|nr:hypothetical protein [Vibrio tetraodonis]MYM58606.1 hypothetical protein [Vibrio tetraodonis subsp. pristinus]
MLGDSMLPWFDLFSDLSSLKTETRSNIISEGWVNIDNYIRKFEQNNLILNGIPYNVDDNRKEELCDAIIHHANIFCKFGLLEKNRGSYPPRLEYRVTKKGRAFYYLRKTPVGRFRRKLFFFNRAILERCKGFKKIIALCAFGMSVVNALKFSTLAFSWLTDIWGIISIAITAGLVALVIGVYSQ